MIAMLRDPKRRASLEAAALKHDLKVGDYIGGRFRGVEANCGFIGSHEDGRLVIRDRDSDEVLDEGWDGLGRVLDAMPNGWHDLHFWREWPADEAIATGQPFALRAMAPVLTDLAHVYLATIR